MMNAMETNNLIGKIRKNGKIISFVLVGTATFTILGNIPKKQKVELSVLRTWQEKNLLSGVEEMMGQVNWGYDKVQVNIVDDSFHYVTSDQGEVISCYSGADYAENGKVWVLNGIELGEEYSIQEVVTPDGFESDGNIYTFVPRREDVISEKDYMIVNYVMLYKERKPQLEQEDSFWIDKYMDEMYGDFEPYLCNKKEKKQLKKSLTKNKM